MTVVTQVMRHVSLSLVALALFWLSPPAAHAGSQEPQLVVFTASWCAACRDIMPVVERLASERGLALFLIDVDVAAAPRQASSRGLAIPLKELPQVYLLQANKSALLFDGEGYLLGHRRAAQKTLSSQLRQALGEPAE